MLVWEELSDENKLAIAEASRAYGITIDECIKAANTLGKAMVAVKEISSKIFDEITELWKNIQETMNQLGYIIEEKPHWNPPRKIIMKSQVVDRRPKYICARNRL